MSPIAPLPSLMPPQLTSSHFNLQNNSNDTHGTLIAGDDISTIFVVGFPEDMQEREFQNMFIFSPGFEAATLKIPSKDMDDDIPTTNNNGMGGRKQTIGFAKFRTRKEAQDARDVLNGRKVDADKGSVLKAEMAKKNLHTKRGLSNHTESGKQPPVAPVTLNFPPSTQRFTNAMGLPSVYDAFYSVPAPLSSPTQFSESYSDLFSPISDAVFSPLESTRSGTTGDFFRYDRMIFAGMSPPVNNSNGLNSMLEEAYPSHQSPPPPPLTLPHANDTLSTRLSGLTINTSGPPATEPMNGHGGLPSPPGMMPPGDYRSLFGAISNPADQNPPCNTLYVGNLPSNTSEEELQALFATCIGYKRLMFRNKPSGPMCFVEFENVACASQALQELHGNPLSNSVKGGIRLSYSKNPLGVRQGVN